MSEYDSIPSGPGPFIVTHHGQPVHVRQESTNDALAYLHRLQGQSWAYALTYGGYAVVAVPADRWSEVEAASVVSSARSAWKHEHGPADRDTLTRENCSACVLAGFGENDESGHLEPNHCSWQRLYVETRRGIPARYLPAFLAEMAKDTPYARALRLSVGTFGVRVLPVVAP